jgi:hypothetical protein
MKLLAPYILSCNLVDRWDIWENTDNKDDMSFFNTLSEQYEIVRIIKHPTGIIKGSVSINDFYPDNSTDKDTVYIRFDDDIVWISPDFFKNFLDFRINNPDYFLVFPVIVNNAICSHLLQIEGIIEVDKYINAYVLDEIGWKNPIFAHELHKIFLKVLFENANSYKRFLLKRNYPIALNRFSTNCISWFGRDFELFNGNVTGGEEEFLTVQVGPNWGRINIIFGKALVSHFAFHVQCDYLDKTNILESYEKILLNNPNRETANIYKEISNFLSTTEKECHK